MFMTISILLTGCFNKENKANEILDYLDKVDMIEGQSRSNLGNFSSEIREITENNDIPEMIRLIEDNVLPTFKDHVKEINEIELHYRSTKKVRELHIELINEAISYYEWQLEVLHAEAPKKELEEIMKEEEDIFGLKTERDTDTRYMKGLSKLDKKEKEFTRELDYYWDAYNIGEYMDE